MSAALLLRWVKGATINGRDLTESAVIYEMYESAK
jgi:hypothetical protein